MNEKFEKWAKDNDVNLTRAGGHDDRYAYPRTTALWLAWEASRKQALEEAATKAETEICECCWRKDAKEAAEEIAFQIRALQKN